jgi:phosphonate transport system substrate-binding protein
MDTSSPTPARFSLRNVLSIVAPCALVALGIHFYLNQRAEMVAPSTTLQGFLRLHLKSPTKLDQGLVAEDGELVAAAPKGADKQIDPATLVFAVLGDDLDREKTIFADFIKHLATTTGKKIELVVPDSVDQELGELRDGKIHLAAFATGSVSTAVNKGGFVPFCVMADENGKFGYEMQIVVPASSPAKTPADLKGSSISFGSPYSHSGFKAPIVILWNEFKLQPGRDYHPSNAGGQKMTIKGVEKGEIKAGAVASDLLKRWTASGEVDAKKIKTIYTSTSFPNACFGHAHQLKPELAAKIKAAFFDFNWKGTSLEKEYAAAGYAKFAPVSYKADWAVVRQMDEQATKLVESELASATK